MIDLAHCLREVAIVLKELRQGYNVRQRLAEMSAEVPHLGRVRAGAGEQAGARGRADGLLTIGAVEHHPVLGKPINVGTLDNRNSITAQFWPQIIYGDEKDIGFGRSLRRAGLHRCFRYEQRQNNKKAECECSFQIQNVKLIATRSLDPL